MKDGVTIPSVSQLPTCDMGTYGECLEGLMTVYFDINTVNCFLWLYF